MSNSRFSIFTAPWMLLSLLTVLLWGVWGLESKIIVDRISPWMNQVLFSVGLIPLIAWMLFAKNLRQTPGIARMGAIFGLLTGIFGGIGNLAFYLAFDRGGKAAIVVPLVGLAPLISVVIALIWLHEKMNGAQWAGVFLAMISIYLLSV